jgi:hypothetical protein
MFVLLLRLFVLIGLPLIVYAQVDTGSITGIVRDPSGAVVQNAEINITNAATGISVALQSNGDGLYSTPNLKSGVYNVSASASGFSTVTRSGIEVHLQDRVTVDFELPLGQTSNSVSVESSVTALETETSSLGQVVEERAIKNLPLNGRNYIQLATLAAGASPSQRSNERNALVANGARSIQNSYLLDGIDNKNKIVGFDSFVAQSIEPVLDSVQEFNVQTSSFSAEFGQSAGAIVNVTTKSGTNQLHGSAFEFLRNSFLDASPYFQPANTANPQFIQNQFGATLGGPIIKDRTFFFFGWQSSREVNAAPQLASVPTDAQKNGLFTAAIYDPATTVANPAGSGYLRTAFTETGQELSPRIQLFRMGARPGDRLLRASAAPEARLQQPLSGGISETCGAVAAIRQRAEARIQRFFESIHSQPPALAKHGNSIVQQTATNAIRWLNENHNQGPFYLQIEGFDPHEPWDPPQEFLEKYLKEPTAHSWPEPPYGNVKVPEEGVKRLRANYAGEASNVDYWYGKVLDKIGELGLFENSVGVSWRPWRSIERTTPMGEGPGEAAHAGNTRSSDTTRTR